MFEHDQDESVKQRQQKVSDIANALMAANEEVINNAITSKAASDVELVMAVGISFCDTSLSIIDAITENNLKAGASKDAAALHASNIIDSILDATVKSFTHYKMITLSKLGGNNE